MRAARADLDRRRRVSAHSGQPAAMESRQSTGVNHIPQNRVQVHPDTSPASKRKKLKGARTPPTRPTISHPTVERIARTGATGRWGRPVVSAGCEALTP